MAQLKLLTSLNIILAALCHQAIGGSSVLQQPQSSSGVLIQRSDTSNAHCLVIIDGVQQIKLIGDSWNTTDPCIKHFCQIENGTVVEKPYREYCLLTCNNEFEMITQAGQCCGNCVQRKCKSRNGRLYQVGDMWKSEDSCTFFECINGNPTVKMISYKKSCPAIPKNCPKDRIGYKDCCMQCLKDETADKPVLPLDLNPKKSNNSDFIFKPDQYDKIMDPATYDNHPCTRECKLNAAPMICNYTFYIEWYETLSKACFDCPYNETDCYRPHCIFGDGMRRSILVINRMMPGPMLQVCYGDTVQVDVINHMMGESTTIHWHGMHMKDSPYSDGVPHITQCPIDPKTTYRYIFRADHEGTHWWHSHVGVQRSDGAFGALIVRKPFELIPKSISRLYEFDLATEHTIMIQDWEHISALSGFNAFHHSIGDNKPKTILINGRGKYFALKENKTSPEVKIVDLESFKKISRGETVDETTTTRWNTELPTTYSNDIDIIHHDINVVNTNVESVTSMPGAVTETTTDIGSITSTSTIKLNSTNNKIRITRNIVENTVLPPLEVFHVKAGKSYRFRTINAGFLNCPVEISIDNHNLTVISSDGWYFEPVEVSTLVTYAGERFDFVLKTDQPIGNYWLRIRGLMDCDERFTKAHQVAILRYAGAVESLPQTELYPTWDYVRSGLQMNALNRGTGLVDSVSVAELTSLDADDSRLLNNETDFKFFVYYDFYDKDNPHFNHPNLYSNADNRTILQNRFIGPQLNRITMKMTDSPMLSTRFTLDESKFCNETSLKNKEIDCTEDFCECTHVLQVPLNATVEMILVDEGYRYDANHPFHLHGHGFRIVGMERIKPTGLDVAEIQAMDSAGQLKRKLQGAITKDTVTVPDGGYTIIRFVADNPGYWIFHCHIEYHVEVGMALVFKIGTHEQMMPVPKNFPTCSNYMPKIGDDKQNSALSQIINNNYRTTIIVSIVLSLILSNFINLFM